ncbi:hypothetical protein YC2023_083104 [Brassica napus]
MAVWSIAMIKAKVARTCSFGFWAEVMRCHPPEAGRKRVGCLAMDGGLPTVRLSTFLLKSGQSASREEAVEEMKDCRSISQHWCRSTMMPAYGLSIFYDRLKPISNPKLSEYP